MKNQNLLDFICKSIHLFTNLSTDPLADAQQVTIPSQAKSIFYDWI